MSEIGPGPEDRDAPPSQPASPEAAAPPPVRDRETNQWAMFIHFSILAGWVVPVVAGDWMRLAAIWAS